MTSLTFNHQDQVHEPTKITENLEKISAITDRWWVKWSQDAFPFLCPRQKWTSEKCNMKQDDIVMLIIPSKLGKGSYRLERVEEIHPDHKEVVRTVTIAYRDKVRATGEKPEELKASLTRDTMAVQGLVVLLPAEEAWPKDRGSFNSLIHSKITLLNKCTFQS